MNLLLKINIVISKWIDSESVLMRMQMITKDERVRETERYLEALYFESLSLISNIYRAGQSRGGRFSRVVSLLEPEPSSQASFSLTICCRGGFDLGVLRMETGVYEYREPGIVMWTTKRTGRIADQRP